MITLEHLVSVYLAELEKLHRRVPAWIGYGVSIVTGLGPALLWLFGLVAWYFLPAPPDAPPEMADQSYYELFAISIGAAVRGAFAFRGFLFFPLVMFALAAVMMAGELGSRAVREDLLRAVPRWAVFAAKWTALATWIGANALICWVLSMGFALIFYSHEDPYWAQVGWALLKTVLAEFTFASLALCIATWTRSVAATIVVLILALFAQLGMSFVFAIADMSTLDGVKVFVSQAFPGGHLVPEAAIDWPLWVIQGASAWQPPFMMQLCVCQFSATSGIDWAVDPLSWRSAVSLGVILIGALGLGLFRFEKMDVP